MIRIWWLWIFELAFRIESEAYTISKQPSHFELVDVKHIEIDQLSFGLHFSAFNKSFNSTLHLNDDIFSRHYGESFWQKGSARTTKKYVKYVKYM